MEKKIYETAEIEVIQVEKEDVIRTSGDNNDLPVPPNNEAASISIFP